jgi:hypothetical protein
VSSVPRRRWSVGRPRAKLLIVAAQDPASRGVNEVDLPTRLAAHSLIGLAGIIGAIVRDPALDVEARVRTTEE